MARVENKPDYSEYQVTPLPDRIAILASGGLDSSVMLGALAESGREVFPIYIRAGLSWERSELPALKRFVRALHQPNIRSITVLNLPMRDLTRDHWTVTGRDVPDYDAPLASNYIQGRNLMLLAKAAIFCAQRQIGEIAMAPLESNPFPDARPEFFRAFSRTVELGMGLKLRVRVPFAGMTKAEVVQRGAAMPLELTLSCAHPNGDLHCGACTKCAERIEGFRAAGVSDPTRYAGRSRKSH
jgi:7-cyano-7-deazaguanine synthase